MINNSNVISKIASEYLCEIIMDLTNLINVGNINDYNELCCKLILIFLDKFDSKLNCLSLYLTGIIDEGNCYSSINDCFKYVTVIKSICVDSSISLITVANNNKGKLIRDLVRMFSIKENNIQCIVCYILNVLFDQAPKLISCVNISEISSQLVDIIIKRDVCEDDPFFTNCIVMIIILLKYSDLFHNYLMENSQTSFIIRKLIILQDKNVIYCKYGIKLLDLLLSSEINGPNMVQCLTQSSNITEYLFDLLVTGKTMIPSVIKCLKKFVECKEFCESNVCAYGLMNVLRCCQSYLDTTDLRVHEMENLLKFFNDIMLNYNGNVILFVNESTARSFLCILTTLMKKSIKSLFLLGCQALIVFLNRYYSVRPFPYQQLIEYLDLFETINGKMFRQSSDKSANLKNKSLETILKNRCVFINLHIDFIFELIRFATIDRSSIIISEEITQQINAIHGYAYSIFFSTYLRYLMSLLRRRKFLNLLSIDKFLEVTFIVLSSSNNFTASKSSLMMIFPQLMSALLILTSEIRSDSYIFNVDVLETVTLNLLEICTIDMHMDVQNWKTIIAKGILAITDCSIAYLLAQCSADQNELNYSLTSLWMLCSLLEIDIANSKSSKSANENIAILENFDRIFSMKLLENLISSSVIFSVKLIKLIKLLLDSPDYSKYFADGPFTVLNFVGNLCNHHPNLMLPDVLSHLIIDLSLLKLINCESVVCMKSTQMIISKSFTYHNVFCENNISSILHCNLIDLFNIVIVSFSAIFKKDLTIVDHLNSVLTLLNKDINKFQCSQKSYDFSENMANQLIERIWMIPDKLYMDEILQNQNFRYLLWQTLDIVFMCSKLFTETVPLLKITSLVTEVIKQNSINVIETEIMFKLLLKASLNDSSCNVRTQLISIFCNEKETSNSLPIVSSETNAIKYRKLILIATFILECEQNCNYRFLNKIHVSGQFLLQCIDHCCKINGNLSQVCGLILLRNIFNNNGWIDSQGPCLLNPECILQIISLLYTVIIDRSEMKSRYLAVEIFGKIIKLCTLSKQYAPLEDQIISSVWIEIIIENLLSESTSNETCSFLYNEICLYFLYQLLESQSSAINISISSTIFRSFSVWFVQHSLSDMPKSVAHFTSQLVIKMCSHQNLICFNEAEKICLLKKLATDNCYQENSISSVNIEINQSDLMQYINQLLEL